MLARYKRLPYFRMSACNSGNYPFDRLTEPECISIATEAIQLIGQYATIGYSVAVDKAAFAKIVTTRGFVSTPYELCSWGLLILARTRTMLREGDIGMSFFFKSGFQDQGPANKMMGRIFKNPKWRTIYGYRSHTFIDKTECRPTQAADLLAWQWYKDATRRANGLTKPRGDLKALLEGTRHYVIHLNNDTLQEFVDYVNAKAGTPLGNEVAVHALRASEPIFAKRQGESGSQQTYEELKSYFGMKD